MGQQDEMVRSSSVCSFLERPPELQEWCPGGEQMVEIPEKDLPKVIFGYFEAGLIEAVWSFCSQDRVSPPA